MVSTLIYLVLGIAAALGTDSDAATGTPNPSDVLTDAVTATTVAGGPEPSPYNPECNSAVSMTMLYHNDHCMQMCTDAGGNISLVQDFTDGRCALQSYTVDQPSDQVFPDGCFNQWIYGYSQGGEEGYKNYTVETPALCQLKCQQDPLCDNWFWVTELGSESDGSMYRCVLKNRRKVYGALGTEIPQVYYPEPIPGQNYNVCASGMDYECLQGGYTCLQCDSITRCVWKSHAHIGGYRFCASGINQCNPDVVLMPVSSCHAAVTENENETVSSESKSVPQLPSPKLAQAKAVVKAQKAAQGQKAVMHAPRHNSAAGVGMKTAHLTRAGAKGW